LSDFQQILQHELHERRTNRVYVLALFAAIAVVVAALMEGFGVWADRPAVSASSSGPPVGQLYLTEIASSASSSNDIR
jgi:hypothetical protein